MSHRPCKILTKIIYSISHGDDRVELIPLTGNIALGSYFKNIQTWPLFYKHRRIYWFWIHYWFIIDILIHCLNHRLKLVVEDVFKMTTLKIDKILNELYKLYQCLSKCLWELKRFAEAWDETIPKPLTASLTCWIDCKIQAMLIVLEDYGTCMQHLSLPQIHA